MDLEHPDTGSGYLAPGSSLTGDFAKAAAAVILGVLAGVAVLVGLRRFDPLFTIGALLLGPWLLLFLFLG